MSAFNPIGPNRAVEICDAAQVADAKAVIAEFAAAGLIRSYARLIETVQAEGKVLEKRDATIPRDLWRRIIAERKLADVWGNSTAKLEGSSNLGTPAIKVVGIRYNETDIAKMAQAHGSSFGDGTFDNGSANATAKTGPTAEREIIAAPPRTGEQEAQASPAGTSAVKAKATKPRPAPNLNSITVSVNDAVALSNLSRSTIYTLMDKGALKSTTQGRRRLVVTQSLKDLLASRSKKSEE